MAEVRAVRLIVDTVATIELNGEELKALDALAGYGVDSFLKVFYQHLGKSYLEPHEKGLRSFLAGVNGCARMTQAADECREFLQHEEKDRRAGLVAARNGSRIQEAK